MLFTFTWHRQHADHICLKTPFLKLQLASSNAQMQQNIKDRFKSMRSLATKISGLSAAPWRLNVSQHTEHLEGR